MASPTNDTDTISDAMDYAQHEATWKTFTNLVKWAIIGLAVLVLALFVFINP